MYSPKTFMFHLESRKLYIVFSDDVTNKEGKSITVISDLTGNNHHYLENDHEEFNEYKVLDERDLLLTLDPETKAWLLEVEKDDRKLFWFKNFIYRIEHTVRSYNSRFLPDRIDNISKEKHNSHYKEKIDNVIDDCYIDTSKLGFDIFDTLTSDIKDMDVVKALGKLDYKEVVNEELCIGFYRDIEINAVHALWRRVELNDSIVPSNLTEYQELLTK